MSAAYLLWTVKAATTFISYSLVGCLLVSSLAWRVKLGGGHGKSLSRAPDRVRAWDKGKGKVQGKAGARAIRPGNGIWQQEGVRERDLGASGSGGVLVPCLQVGSPCCLHPGACVGTYKRERAAPGSLAGFGRLRRQRSTLPASWDRFAGSWVVCWDLQSKRAAPTWGPWRSLRH